MNIPKRILPVIVISQFFCTSLWFAGNSVMNDLTVNFGLNESALGHLTSFVQFGFITGTLIFAILSIADRFSPSKVFLICAILGASFNLAIIGEWNNLSSILIFRFFTGFFLAGIYPVGMKIAADYFEKGLGKSLGFLVGALALGTALPHLLKGLVANSLPWESVLITTSILATVGGLLIFLLVPDGPYRKKSQKLQLAAFFKVFQQPTFRSAAIGYFGHMWELYAFWAFVPVLLKSFASANGLQFSISELSFLIIGSGGIGCIIGGYLAHRYGTKRIAMITLLISGICCLLLPILFSLNSPILFIVFLLIWGTTVIADSPLFSTLVAQNAPPELKGTALTIVNCIGFSITIVSIQLLNTMNSAFDSNTIYMILAIGPVLGLIALVRNKRR